VTDYDLEERFSEIKILSDELFKNYAFTEVGGPVDFLVFPKSVSEVRDVVNYANEHDLPWLVLGSASNLIVRDGGIRGIVVMLSEMKKIEVDGAIIISQAGAKLVDLSHIALSASLSGMEFACGIPGSIGGAIFMNAGAYGGEISRTFVSAEILLNDGAITTWDNAKMNFGYRCSVLQKEKAVVLSAKFILTTKEQELIKLQMNEFKYFRKLKQPLEYPSCGSVFKRPMGYFAGKLIRDAGLQGKQIGGAQVSKKHAGFIVNVGKASAADYENLIKHIIEVVQKKFGVRLHTEVQIIGEKSAKIDRY